MIESKEDNQYPDMIDLKDNRNKFILDELKDMGTFGDFVLRLLDQAKRENTDLKIEGMGTQEYNVFYGNESVFFTVNVNVDAGDAPIESGYLGTNIECMKKPWVSKILDQMPNKNWVRVRPLDFSRFCDEVVGENQFSIKGLESRYPKLSRFEIKDILLEEFPDLQKYFFIVSQKGRPNFAMTFKDEAMKKKYMNDDPAFFATFKPILEDALPKIHKKLAQLNEAKSK